MSAFENGTEGGPLRILVIDDEPDYCALLAEFLVDEGFVVQTATDADSAVGKDQEFAPDLVIVDWMLKNRLDGLAVVEALRARHPQLAAIVMTGYPSSVLESRSRDLAHTLFLAKPFRLDEIREAIRTLVCKEPRSVNGSLSW